MNAQVFEVYWCPRCECQSRGPFHLCRPAAPLFPQTSQETQCERVLAVPAAAKPEAPGNLIAAVTWWRDYASNLRAGRDVYPVSPYPPDSYGVPTPPPGVAFGASAGSPGGEA